MAIFYDCGFAACGAPPTKVDLTEVASKGLVQATASGNGLESVALVLISKSSAPLEVTIFPGTIFQARSTGTQNMVAREKRVVRLTRFASAGSWKSLISRAACANMRLAVPSGDDTFAISNIPVSEDLKKLLSLPAFDSEDFRVQQFAIWTITDNPWYGGYIGIGAFGFGTGPNEDERQRVSSTLWEGRDFTLKISGVSDQATGRDNSSSAIEGRGQASLGLWGAAMVVA